MRTSIGCATRLPSGWWNCDLSFTSHAELRMDYGATGRPVGVEITAPQAVPLSD
jgi:hypothetical protein